MTTHTLIPFCFEDTHATLVQEVKCFQKYFFYIYDNAYNIGRKLLKIWIKWVSDAHLVKWIASLPSTLEILWSILKTAYVGGQQFTKKDKLKNTILDAVQSGSHKNTIPHKING